MSIPYCFVVAWHNQEQIDKFREAWKSPKVSDRLVFQQDKNKEGCAATKNKGIAAARERDPEVIIVLDDDCYDMHGLGLETFAQQHILALEPQDVELFEAVTDPPSRGTPYYSQTVKMPVAASMGFWTEHPDYDAITDLCERREPWKPTPIKYHRKTMFWRFFPLSGMNLAWSNKQWPNITFVEGAERFDDIWLGFKWQREAYDFGYCFNLGGPMVRHVRQSNVWHNLKVESENLEKNETYWQSFATIFI